MIQQKGRAHSRIDPDYIMLDDNRARKNRMRKNKPLPARSTTRARSGRRS
jgi:hypothetical protein